MKRTTCSRHHATDNEQSTTRNRQRAADSVQQELCSGPHATFGHGAGDDVRQTTCNSQRAAGSVLQPTGLSSGDSSSRQQSHACARDAVRRTGGTSCFFAATGTASCAMAARQLVRGRTVCAGALCVRVCANADAANVSAFVVQMGARESLGADCTWRFWIAWCRHATCSMHHATRANVEVAERAGGLRRAGADLLGSLAHALGLPKQSTQSCAAVRATSSRGWPGRALPRCRCGRNEAVRVWGRLQQVQVQMWAAESRASVWRR